MRIERRHAILVPAAIDRVFPLFTPRGELDWVPGWAPVFLWPADGETCEGMVFRTGSGSQATLWGCAHWRPEQHHARYVRVTPASRFAYVTVDCESAGPEATRVSICYEMTALTPDGQADLDGIGPDAFRAMIEDWRGLVTAWLARGAGAA